jgi:HPt (histidine-containing phosphotransfer) domain-containing protein
MAEPIVDFSFVYQMSENDPKYVYDIVSLYLKVVPSGIENLEKLAKEGKDYEAIVKQAHFLKSSAKVISVRGVYDSLVSVEMEARRSGNIDLITSQVTAMAATIKEALPVLVAEQKKCKPKKS